MIMATRRLDQIDRRIIQELQADARLSNVALASRVGLSPAPCLRRVRALEHAGVIRSYATLVEPSAIDLGVTVFVQVRLDHQVANRFESFERAIVQRPDVLECYYLMGTADYLLRVVLPGRGGLPVVSKRFPDGNRWNLHRGIEFPPEASQVLHRAATH